MDADVRVAGPLQSHQPIVTVNQDVVGRCPLDIWVRQCWALGMADGPETLPVIDPETREGRSVSILTDRRLIVRAVENGWIRDVEIMRELRDE